MPPAVLGFPTPYIAPETLSSELARAVREELVTLGASPDEASPLVEILNLYLVATARAERATEIRDRKVGAAELAAASAGRLNEGQVRYLLDEVEFPIAKVRRALIRKFSPRPTVDALVIETEEAEFAATRSELAGLYALMGQNETLLGCGRYSESVGDRDEEDAGLVRGLLTDACAVCGIELPSGTLPPLFAPSPDSGQNPVLRTWFDIQSIESLTEVGPDYNEVLVADNPFEQEDLPWLPTIEDQLPWLPGDPPPSPRRVRAGRQTDIQLEYAVAFLRDGERHYGLARPDTRSSDSPGGSGRRVRELVAVASTVSALPRLAGLRVQHFAHRNERGFQRVLTALAVLQAVETRLI